jgi:hypothetical protein
VVWVQPLLPEDFWEEVLGIAWFFARRTRRITQMDYMVYCPQNAQNYADGLHGFLPAERAELRRWMALLFILVLSRDFGICFLFPVPSSGQDTSIQFWRRQNHSVSLAVAPNYDSIQE